MKQEHLEYLIDTMLKYLYENYPMPRKWKKRSYFTKEQMPKGYATGKVIGPNAYGMYDNISKTILINKDFMKTAEDVVKTVAHEFMHMTQHNRGDWWRYNYYMVTKRTGYWNNPLEVEAREFEEKIWQEVNAIHQQELEAEKLLEASK